ncbi:MAG: serine/threonine protein kinase [Deltaproteobacteria bacterium]|nr:MAG: serine/threonine protein kinase [Deltaproteobacteria bacterium]
MRVCYDCGYRGPERTCPHDGLPTFDEGGSTTLAEQPDLIGRVFADRYEVVDVLGAGGMGSVFLARHRAMQQDVALKVLKKDIANHPSAIKRFFREARLSAQLSHPNTIRVYDFGASDGQLYLAMEFLQGRTLGAALREDGRLSPERAINVTRQVCAALDAAHNAGMVHRDLKPDNIFLTSLRNAPDFVKVLDFGIAKPVGDAEGDRSGLTNTGLMVGTPRYMSPEQAQGLPIDARTDLYAVGVLLYEMLTGVVPFDAPTPVALLVRHCNEAPPPLPARIGDQIVPMSLRQLVAWLLEKDPKNRPQTAAEVEDALARIGSGGQLLTDDDHTLAIPVIGPELVAPPSPADDSAQSRTTATQLRGRRKRLWLAVAAVVLVAGGSAFAIMGSASGDAKAPEPKGSPRAFTNAANTTGAEDPSSVTNTETASTAPTKPATTVASAVEDAAPGSTPDASTGEPEVTAAVEPDVVEQADTGVTENAQADEDTVTSTSPARPPRPKVSATVPHTKAADTSVKKLGTVVKDPKKPEKPATTVEVPYDL